jgi:hypothetical protein
VGENEAKIRFLTKQRAVCNTTGSLSRRNSNKEVPETKSIQNLIIPVPCFLQHRVNVLRLMCPRYRVMLICPPSNTASGWA